MPEATAKPFGLPFDEAIDFYRQKINLPTKTWEDISGGMHSRAFVVAGATKEDLLSDFNGAIDKAISKGTTLQEFRKDFDGIVEKHGWSHKGGRNWRTRVIYDTNVSTAYQAGRYKQMLDPDVLQLRPYWQYIHGDSKNPRPDHLEWHGKVLRYDDPWWATHRPKNGWGCKCSVRSLSKGDLERQGLSIDEAPKIEIDKKTGIAKGIDKGWDYDPAFSAWGDPIAREAIGRMKRNYTLLNTKTYQDFRRPKDVPIDVAKATLVESGSATKVLKGTLKSEEKIFKTADGSSVLVNAEVLGSHITEGRSKYLHLLPEVIEDPFEVWVTFERDIKTKRVIMRKRFIKGIKTDKDNYSLFVADAHKGVLTGWTFIPNLRKSQLEKQRVGNLIWSRKEK